MRERFSSSRITVRASIAQFDASVGNQQTVGQKPRELRGSSVSVNKKANASRLADIHSLAPRDRQILKDIIRTHVQSGEPVSSRTVSKHSEHRLSAASIRNVMADLEELGLLAQPHTSAGRIPTQAAYRLYVESLMGKRSLPEKDRRYIEETLRSAVHDAYELMSAVSQLLSELSHQVGVVLTPTVEEGVLRAIDFIKVSDKRVLCVLVSSSGFVDHVVIDTEEDLSREELIRISNYVSDNFCGNSMRRIRDRLIQLMSEEKSHVDRWLSQSLELARRAVDISQIQEVLVQGTAGLLDQPELAEVSRIRRMLDTFADKARLVQMLNRCLEGDGVRVFIGEDSDVTSELDFSLVGISYGDGQRSLGSLGILGPSRMEYPRIVPLVHYLGEALSRALVEERLK